MTLKESRTQYEAIIANIKSEMEKSEITPEILAHCVGVSPNTVKNYLKLKNEPSIVVFTTLAYHVKRLADLHRLREESKIYDGSRDNTDN